VTAPEIRLRTLMKEENDSIGVGSFGVKEMASLEKT
jgi:hypothetical protein